MTSAPSPSSSSSDPQGPVVLLSGASSGIGAALAIELARSLKARVALLARRQEVLDGVAAQVEAAGGSALVCPCDVIDEAAVFKAASQCEVRFGPIDIAIANAGVGLPMPGHKATAERMRFVMDVNYGGAANVFAAVIPSMVERQAGHIVGVSSIAGFRGLPASGPYSASKAALTTLLESLRLDLGRRGIAVTAVHPGFVKTPMTDKNNFPMPFMVPVDKAARIIVRGIVAKKRDVNFPWPMVTLIKLLRALPNWLYDALLGRQSGWVKKAE